MHLVDVGQVVHADAEDLAGPGHGRTQTVQADPAVRPTGGNARRIGQRVQGRRIAEGIHRVCQAAIGQTAEVPPAGRRTVDCRYQAIVHEDGPTIAEVSQSKCHRPAVSPGCPGFPRRRHVPPGPAGADNATPTRHDGLAHSRR